MIETIVDRSQLFVSIRPKETEQIGDLASLIFTGEC